MAETTPTRRRPESGIGNEEILANIANENIANENDESKKRRHIYVELGPLVVSGAALDRVRARFLSFSSKLSMDTLRPLPIFLGLTGPSFCIAPDAFSSPIYLTRQTDKSSIEKLVSRLSRNMNYFATNYVFLALCTVLIVALMHPGMLLYVGITWSAWWLHTVIIREDVRLVIVEKDLNDIVTPKRRSTILTVWTIWVAIAKCVRPSLKGMAISGALVLFHALLRDPAKVAGNILVSRTKLSRGSSDSDDGSEVIVEREDAV